ncbi:hypothetical protein SK128_024323, partial [Halocaridina rubra]
MQAITTTLATTLPVTTTTMTTEVTRLETTTITIDAVTTTYSTTSSIPKASNSTTIIIPTTTASTPAKTCDRKHERRYNTQEYWVNFSKGPSAAVTYGKATVKNVSEVKATDKKTAKKETTKPE